MLWNCVVELCCEIVLLNCVVKSCCEIVLLNYVVQFNCVVELCYEIVLWNCVVKSCCWIVLWNCVVQFNWVVELCCWKFSGKREKKEKKNNLFVLFYNEECKAICLSPNHGWKWPHGWRRFNFWQWRLRKASHVELGAQFKVWSNIMKTINTSHYVWPQGCFWILLVILGMN